MRIRDLVESGAVEVFAPFYIHRIMTEQDRLTVVGMLGDSEIAIENVDEIICNTGSRPDMTMLREVRVQFDPVLESVPALADLIDPNVHSCGTVRPHGELELRQPEQDLYIVGSKSYGRAPTFLMTTGYEQVRSVVAALSGDFEAARRVELVLPETGVCGVRQSAKSTVKASGFGCCAIDTGAFDSGETDSSPTDCCAIEPGESDGSMVEYCCG